MIKETVVVLLPGARDRGGKQAPPTRDERTGCRVWPRKSGEGEEGRVVLSGWNVHFPAGKPIPADAALEVRGKTYALYGNVADYGRKGMIAQCRSVGQS